MGSDSSVSTESALVDEVSTDSEDIQRPSTFGDLASLFEVAAASMQTNFEIEEWFESLQQAHNGLDPGPALHVIVSILEYIDKHESSDLGPMTKILADGSQFEPWRLQFGDSGILGFYLERLRRAHGEHIWDTDALRLIGNTCVDLEPNRLRVLEKLNMSFLIQGLRNDKQADLAIGVLCNLCSEFVPAQEVARQRGIFTALVDCLANHTFNPDLLTQVCCLLEFAIENDDVGSMTVGASSVAPTIYSGIMLDGVTTDDEVLRANSLLDLLSHEPYRRLFIAQDVVVNLLALLVFTYTHDQRILMLPWTIGTHDVLQRLEENEEDEGEMLCNVRTKLNERLWDISAMPEFQKKYDTHSDLVQILISWLLVPQSAMQLCACAVLRNIACHDDASKDLVQKDESIPGLQISLLRLFKKCSCITVIPEALRLFSNLALPQENKGNLTEGQAFKIITYLWSKFDNPTVQCAAVHLVRMLIRGSITNVSRLLLCDKQDNDFSAPSTELSTSFRRLLFLDSVTQDLPTRMELARTIVAIWREATNQDNESCLDEAMRQVTTTNVNIATTIFAMITDSNNASLVTEAWFGLTLLASSTAQGSSEMVYDCIFERLDTFAKAVREQQRESKDRNNARILADRLLRNEAGKPDRLLVLRHAFRGLEE